MTDVSVAEADAIWTKMPAHHRQLLGKAVLFALEGRDDPNLKDWSDDQRMAGPFVDSRALLGVVDLLARWNRAIEDENNGDVVASVGSLMSYLTGIWFDIADAINATPQSE